MDQPAEDEIIGVWECAELPAGFLREVGDSSAVNKSRIEIRQGRHLLSLRLPRA